MKRIPLTKSSGEEKDLASLFLAELIPLGSIAEFKGVYDAFKKAHPKADHYPYAYVLDGVAKSSDDGEPGGSAGRPMMGLLQNEDIDGALIVARYFGGSKLGIPRLRRAFLASCEQAIASGKYGTYRDVYAYDLEVDYSVYETLRGSADRIGYRLENVRFDLKVSAELRSGAILDGLGEKVGLYDLTLPEPHILRVLEELP